MAIRLGSTVINCADIELMTASGRYRAGSDALELYTDDQAAEVMRLAKLGPRPSAAASTPMMTMWS